MARKTRSTRAYARWTAVRLPVVAVDQTLFLNENSMGRLGFLRATVIPLRATLAYRWCTSKSQTVCVILDWTWTDRQGTMVKRSNLMGIRSDIYMHPFFCMWNPYYLLQYIFNDYFAHKNIFYLINSYVWNYWKPDK